MTTGRDKNEQLTLSLPFWTYLYNTLTHIRDRLLHLQCQFFISFTCAAHDSRGESSRTLTNFSNSVVITHHLRHVAKRMQSTEDILQQRYMLVLQSIGTQSISSCFLLLLVTELLLPILQNQSCKNKKYVQWVWYMSNEMLRDALFTRIYSAGNRTCKSWISR